MATQKKTSAATPILLSVADVAIQLGVCRQTVYNFIYHEKLPSIKVRGMRRIHSDSLSKWIIEREQVLA
jgi:excisionase family DNA binding protein